MKLGKNLTLEMAICTLQIAICEMKLGKKLTLEMAICTLEMAIQFLWFEKKAQRSGLALEMAIWTSP